jgi:hypothetical protein
MSPVTLTLTQSEVSLLLDALYDTYDKRQGSIARFTDDKGDILPYVQGDDIHNLIAKKRDEMAVLRGLHNRLISVWRPNQENAA